MIHKPVVFISSTSDLRAARDLVGKVLYSMGYEPVWQDTEPTDGGELLDVLRQRIEPCAMVIQLVGSRYGAEPPAPTPEFGRVSYTQFEALYGERIGKKVIYHFLASTFPADASAPEPTELAQMQSQYRRGLEAENRLRHVDIASSQDLELSVRRISNELANLRAQGERRIRRMTWLVVGTIVGLIAVVMLLTVALRRQTQSERDISARSAALGNDLAAIRAELRAAIAPRPRAGGESAAPGRLSPEQVTAANTLLAQGDTKDQALAKIALKQHAEADRIIQSLKAKPDNSVDDVVHYLRLEGDNWYQAGQIERAIGPYEQAMALRPGEIETRNILAALHLDLGLDESADSHLKRAIEICQRSLEIVSPNTPPWGRTQYMLGLASQNLTTGDAAENNRRAIAAYDAALSVVTLETDPENWGTLHQVLGAAWQDMSEPPNPQDLQKSIDALNESLKVFSGQNHPIKWARSQQLIGTAWQKFPGDTAENLRKALAAYDAALSVVARESDNAEMWGTIQQLRGTALQLMPGNEAEHLPQAVAAYEAALTVITREKSQRKWATLQQLLGVAWFNMPTGDRRENLHKALAAYDAALGVFTEKSDPRKYELLQKLRTYATQEMAGLGGK